MSKILDSSILQYSQKLSRLILFFVGIVFIGCSKKEAVILPEVSRPQTVVFDILPSRDYTSHPANYFFDVKLSLTRKLLTGEDLPVWDTVIQKLRVNSLEKYSAQKMFHQPNQTPGFLSAHYSFEYYYDDKVPVLYTSGETWLNYYDSAYIVSVLW